MPLIIWHLFEFPIKNKFFIQLYEVIFFFILLVQNKQNENKCTKNESIARKKGFQQSLKVDLQHNSPSVSHYPKFGPASWTEGAFVQKLNKK